MAIVCFAGFRFDTRDGELHCHGRHVPLEHQPSLALSRLLASDGQLVTREELAAAIWPAGTHVKVDDGLNYCIRKIREALGDDPKSPRFLATVPRRGYRFLVPVTPAVAPPGRRTTTMVGVALAAAAVLTLVLESRPNQHHALALSVARALHDLVF